MQLKSYNSFEFQLGRLLFKQALITQIAKKLAFILMIFILITLTSKKAKLVVICCLETQVLAINVPSPLQYMLFIYYLLRFRKKKSNVKVLIDFDNEVNAMILVYVKKTRFLDLKNQCQSSKN